MRVMFFDAINVRAPRATPGRYVSNYPYFTWNSVLLIQTSVCNNEMLFIHMRLAQFIAVRDIIKNNANQPDIGAELELKPALKEMLLFTRL